MRFEWDENKNRSNIRKHGVSFEEAVSAFVDEHGLMIYDEQHSVTEERFLLLGHSYKAGLLVVCHCYRYEETIRIISARKATTFETDTYYARW